MEQSFSIYSAKANIGKTTDGIANGGRRLAAEIQAFAKEKSLDNNTSTLSIIGNSLGGLYARYALSTMNFDDLQVEPLIFCTTSTPHLGNTQNTFFNVPSWAEWFVGNAMQETGADLFHLSATIPEMCLLEKFLSPLRRFRKRLAIANAYGTDFLVPVSTAAFLTNSSSVHRKVHNSSENCYIRHSILEVATEQEVKQEGEPSMAESLDALGWTKMFVDIRDLLPPLFRLSSQFEHKDTYSSQQLGKLFEWSGSLAPFGHPLMVANSRTDLYRWLTAKGQPIMDDLANRFIRDILALAATTSNDTLL